MIEPSFAALRRQAAHTLGCCTCSPYVALRQQRDAICTLSTVADAQTCTLQDDHTAADYYFDSYAHFGDCYLRPVVSHMLVLTSSANCNMQPALRCVVATADSLHSDRDR